MAKNAQRPALEGEQSSGTKGIKKRPPPHIRPPLMPLIDVMFTLLMFFLVAARVRVPEGLIPANLPELGKGRPGVTVRSPLKITLYAVGQDNAGVRMQVENSTQDLSGSTELYSYLTQVKNRLGDEVPIEIKPAGDVRWEHVVNAFNQAVRASFKKVGFGRVTG